MRKHTPGWVKKHPNKGRKEKKDHFDELAEQITNSTSTTEET